MAKIFLSIEAEQELSVEDLRQVVCTGQER